MPSISIKKFCDSYQFSFLEIWRELFSEYKIKDRSEYEQYLSKKLHSRIILTAPMIALIFIIKFILYFFSLSIQQFFWFLLIDFTLIDGALLAMLITSVFSKNLNESYYKNMLTLAAFALFSCVLLSAYAAIQHIYFPYEIIGMSILLFLWIFNYPFKWVITIPLSALIIYFIITISLNNNSVYEKSITIIALIVSFIIGLFYSLMNGANEYRLYQSLKNAESQAMTDALTKIYNRNGFMHHFEQHKKIAQREKKKIYIAILDIDNFKKINDSYGHDIGDNVITMVAAKISELYRRPLDLVARWGGEEFIISWCEENPDRISTTGNKICQTIAETIINNHIKVTVSVGMTLLTEKDISFTETLKRADTALYTAKHNGKNQCILA
jgi:diguanylate cyclase (GGDEF)-like protein